MYHTAKPAVLDRYDAAVEELKGYVNGKFSDDIVAPPGTESRAGIESLEQRLIAVRKADVAVKSAPEMGFYNGIRAAKKDVTFPLLGYEILVGFLGGMLHGVERSYRRLRLTRRQNVPA